MFCPRPARFLPVLGAALLLGASSLSALDLDGLVKNSPFGAGTAKAVEDAKPGTLEFRGMYVDRGVTYFSIYNATTKQSTWVKQGETADGPVPFVVKGYDADNEAVLLENGGQPVKIALHTATVTNFTSSAAAIAPAPTTPAVAAQPATGTGFAFNNGQPPTPEQIQAFRDEMRRRFGRGGPGGADGSAPGGEGVDPRSMRRDRGSDASAAPTGATSTRTKPSKTK